MLLIIRKLELYKRLLNTFKVIVQLRIVGSQQFLGAFSKLRKVTISFIISARPSVCLCILPSARNKSAPIGRILIKFEYFSKICPENSSFIKTDNSNGYFTWRPKYIMAISCSALLRIRHASDKNFRGNQNILWLVTFSENRAVYEIMWKHMLQPERPQMTVRRMRFACWITKVTDTNLFLFLGTVQERTRLSIAVQIHCLFCLILVGLQFLFTFVSTSQSLCLKAIWKTQNVLLKVSILTLV